MEVSDDQQIYQIWIEFRKFFTTINEYFTKNNIGEFNLPCVSKYYELTDTYFNTLIKIDKKFKFQVDKILSYVKYVKINIGFIKEELNSNINLNEIEAILENMDNIGDVNITTIDNFIGRYEKSLNQKKTVMLGVVSYLFKQLPIIRLYFNDIIEQLSKSECQYNNDLPEIIATLNGHCKAAHQHNIYIIRELNSCAGDLKTKLNLVYDVFANVISNMKSTTKHIEKCYGSHTQITKNDCNELISSIDQCLEKVQQIVKSEDLA